MAGIDPTSICNLALREIGAERITNYAQDTSKEARVCRDLFHPTRRRALAMNSWNGARKSVGPLTQMEDTTPTFWGYCFEVPDDIVRVISVHPINDLEVSCPYELGFQEGSGDDEAKIYAIFADSNQLYMRYIFDQQDLSALSPGFHDILAFELARVFAVALNRSEAAKELTTKELRRRITLAKSIDGQENYPSKMAEGSWHAARFGRYGRTVTGI